jgi:hypothetical protein
MNGYPENWESMGARARHEWGVKQRKLQNMPDSKPAVIPVAKSQPTGNGSSLQEQYFYYSTMIKSDEQSLKNIPDHAERDKRKPALLNKYREYLEEYIAAQETHDNNVLFYCMVWACDVEQYDWALMLCDYAVKTNQKNDAFRRSHAEIVADAVFWRCEKIFKSGAKLPAVWREIFSRVFNKNWLIDSDLTARYLKLEGDIIKETEPKLALQYFQQAQQLKADIGVKGRIAALEKTLNDG